MKIIQTLMIKLLNGVIVFKNIDKLYKQWKKKQLLNNDE